MAENYNSMAFTPEEVEKGQHLKLLKTLFELNADKEDASYNDIHIWTDGYCTIIDWVDYNPEFGMGKFEFVPGDGYILREFRFPDGHYEMLADDDEFNEALKDWLKENPGWEQTSYGTWTNRIENEHFRKLFEGDGHKDEDVEEKIDNFNIESDRCPCEILQPEDYAE